MLCFAWLPSPPPGTLLLRVVLGSYTIECKLEIFSNIPCSQQCSPLVTSDESYLTHHYHPKSLKFKVVITCNVLHVGLHKLIVKCACPGCPVRCPFPESSMCSAATFLVNTDWVLNSDSNIIQSCRKKIRF